MINEIFHGMDEENEKQIKKPVLLLQTISETFFCGYVFRDHRGSSHTDLTADRKIHYNGSSL